MSYPQTFYFYPSFAQPMDFINRLFGFQKNQQQPDIPFGRFSDAYKSDAQQQAFDRSLEAFEQGDHLAAYRDFFSFLKLKSFTFNPTYQHFLTKKSKINLPLRL